MSVYVKQITMEDAHIFDSIVTVENNAFKKTSLTIWTLESYVRYGYTFCLFNGDEVTGVATFMNLGDNNKAVYGVSMAIDTNSHNRNLGTILLEQSLLTLKNAQIRNVYLHVDPLNFPAVHMYIDKFGFEFVDYRLNEYGVNQDRAYLGLSLSVFKDFKSSKEVTLPLEYVQIEKSQKLSKTLRAFYYQNTVQSNEVRKQPLFGLLSDGMPTESLGPFPEFILPTHPCFNSLKGYCSPCFFSKHPPTLKSDEVVFDSLITQTKYIVENFDELVIKYQMRGENNKIPNVDVTFCYACNGSFFSNSETISTLRKQALQMLCNEVELRKLRALVYIETCSFDFKDVYESGELEELLPFLKRLNTHILFGFESSTHFTRNVLYNKNLSREMFEESISICKKLNLGCGAFVYTGFFAMTEPEIIADVTKTLLYLRALNIIPVLMFPNLQPFTIYHLLYSIGDYNLYDPRTALRLFQILLKVFSAMDSDVDKWLTGDLFGGPPAPPISLFINPQKASCDKCAEIIRRAIMKMKKDSDIESFLATVDSVSSCECKSVYDRRFILQLDNQKLSPIEERTNALLLMAEKKSVDYCESMKKSLN